ncbi:MAG: RecX family transcriptional regulator [Lachnospiraceae bacterium]|nr:RecX family transcriptional regulator [Lachnospiraceae bacterium]
MNVTDLTPKGKKALNVWLDGCKAGFLESREVSAYGLEIGAEVSKERWQKIVADVILPRGKKKALSLLELQDRTTKEMHDRLLMADYTEEQVWDIIAYVVSFGYIDEHRYAYQYIKNHARTKSRREITQALLLKGVERDLIESSYERYAEESTGAEANASAGETGERSRGASSVEEDAVRRFVAARVKGTEITQEKRRKVFGALTRKGFSYAAIRSVLADYRIIDAGDEIDAAEGWF